MEEADLDSPIASTLNHSGYPAYEVGTDQIQGRFKAFAKVERGTP